MQVRPKVKARHKGKTSAKVMASQIPKSRQVPKGKPSREPRQGQQRRPKGKAQKQRQAKA
jgi:hypothetical protein